MAISINTEKLKQMIKHEVQEISTCAHEAECLLGEGTNELGEHYQIRLLVTTVDDSFFDVDKDSFDYAITVEE